MSDTSKGEAARAAREAQDAIVSRPSSTKAGAIGAALRRYLSAERYDELHGHRATSHRDKTGSTDSQ